MVMEVCICVEGLRPAEFENMCSNIKPPPEARIIARAHVKHYCVWSLHEVTRIHKEEALCLLNTLEASATKLDGCTERICVSVPFDFDDGMELNHGEYIEWTIPMTAINRKGACTRIMRKLE